MAIHKLDLLNLSLQVMYVVIAFILTNVFTSFFAVLLTIRSILHLQAVASYFS